MAKLYIYVMDTLADWEIGHLTAEVYSKRFFKKDAADCALKLVGSSMEPITTMGGMKIVPDMQIDAITPEKGDVLVLPGANTWEDPKHRAAICKAREFLAQGMTVAAICGATVALAATGMLDTRRHTSNGAGFLDMFVPGYSGKDLYVDAPACMDAAAPAGDAGTLITAGSTGGLLFAKYILETLQVMQPEALEAWYRYFSSGDAGAFFALMQAVGA